MVISFILESEARAQEHSGSLTSCLTKYIVSAIWQVKKKGKGMRHKRWLSDTESSNISNKGAHRRIAHTKIMMDRLQSIWVRRYWIDEMPYNQRNSRQKGPAHQERTRSESSWKSTSAPLPSHHFILEHHLLDLLTAILD